MGCAMSPNLSSNMEDYLETIYLIEQEYGFVRVKEIARQIGNTMPSVTSAVKNLEKKGLVKHPRYEVVSLTDEGIEIARRIYHRHEILREFLQDILGLKPEIAEKDACRIEHNISDETMRRLEAFIEQNLAG